jgi:hypothetical protein
MKDTKYQCELTELQLQIIQDALDFLFRMRMGQIQEIHQIRPKGPRIPDELMGQLKVELFPELGTLGSYHSIYSTDLPDECRTAYDLVQVIRHRLSWDNIQEKDKGHTHMFVHFDEPDQSNPLVPLAKLEKLPDE